MFPVQLLGRRKRGQYIYIYIYVYIRFWEVLERFPGTNPSQKGVELTVLEKNVLYIYTYIYMYTYAYTVKTHGQEDGLFFVISKMVLILFVFSRETSSIYTYAYTIKIHGTIQRLQG